MIGYAVVGLLCAIAYLLWQIHMRLIEVFAMQRATVEVLRERLPARLPN